VNRLAVAALLALAASPALAESGRWGAIDIGAESYRPNVDAEFGSAPAGTVPPYEQMFGSGRGWMLRVGFARALYTGFGSLELGIRTGYFQDSGKGVLAGTTVPSGDKTTFKVVPTSLALTYRVDDFAERWNVPLAPYGRVTLERYNWWVNDGGGSTAERGATNGWSVTGGLGFLLDFLDPMLAREFDHDAGVNHTYLYFEATHSSIDDFGSSTSWDLSDESVSLGMGLMFVF